MRSLAAAHRVEAGGEGGGHDLALLVALLGTRPHFGAPTAVD